MNGSFGKILQPRSAILAPLFSAILVAFSAASTLAAAPSGQEQVSRDFQKTLTLEPGQSFRIDNKFGDVHIHGESGRELKISATIRVQAKSRSEAEGYLDGVRIEVEQIAQGVSVRTVYPDEHGFLHIRNASYSVNYDIAMPSDALLYAKNAFGNVNISAVRARSDIENSHGTLEVRDIGVAHLVNSFGGVQLATSAGDADITDNNGNVDVSDVKGAVNVRNRFGNIVLRGIQGAAGVSGGNGNVNLTDASSASITASFGNVDARNIRGDLSVHDNNGNVDFSNVGGSADITNSFGNVTFADVRGKLTCTTNNGRVQGGTVTGPSVAIRNSFGNIDLDAISGSLDAETSNGKITVRDSRGAATLRSSFGAIEASALPKGVRAITGNGQIRLTDIGGDAYAKTSFGAISVERIAGNLAAENTNGSVTARDVKGDASVHTSFAGVTLDSIGGKISVDNQNGAIDVTATRASSGCRDISLRTSFSSIHVAVPEGAGYNLTAHTSFGRISSELPVTTTGTTGSDSLNGTIGPGGCQLQLTDSNGSIEIAKAH